MRKFFSNLLFYLNILAGISLLLSYLSTFIPPDKIWVLAFFGLAYPYILIVNVLFVIYYIIRGKLRFLFSLAVIILGFSHLNSYIPVRIGKEKRNAEREMSRSLKVLSFNVRAFNIFEWYSNPETSKNIINLIRSEKPDIICLQEYYTKPSKGKNGNTSALFSNTPYSYIRYFMKNGANSGYGIAIFSKYPIVSRGAITFKNTSNETIFADLAIDNDTIRVYNNHLQSVKLHQKNYEFLDTLKLTYDEKDLREIKDISIKLKTAFEKRSVQVNSISSHIRKCPYPVIVCGDFNDTPVSYTYRKMKKGLKDAFVSAGKGVGNTYAGIFPSFRIDFILYSPEKFTPIVFEKVEAELSDHYPIFCTFDYKKTAGKETN